MEKNMKIELLKAVKKGAELNFGRYKDCLIQAYGDCGVVALVTDWDIGISGAAALLSDMANNSGLPIKFDNFRTCALADDYVCGIRIPMCIDNAFKAPQYHSRLVEEFTDSGGNPNHWNEFAADCDNCTRFELCRFVSKGN